MNISKITAALAILSLAVDPVINAARPTIQAEINRLEKEAADLVVKRKAVEAKYTELFDELRASQKSVKGLYETSQGAQKAIFASTMNENREQFSLLHAEQKVELDKIEADLRAMKSHVGELERFAQGIPMSREAAAAVDNKIARVNGFLFDQVGMFFRTMTSPSAGGVGMPSAKGGGYEGFGSAFKGDEIDPNLSETEKAVLFTTVSKCVALRLRFVDARAPFWQKLTLAARQYELIQEATSAPADTSAEAV